MFCYIMGEKQKSKGPFMDWVIYRVLLSESDKDQDAGLIIVD